MHLNSKLLFEKYVRSYFKPGIKVLEIGPYGIPSLYQQLINDPSIQWDTVDIAPCPGLTYTCQEYSFPIPDNSYDLVISGQVLEHVKKIWVWMREVSRVCKQDGHVITINPVSFPYHEAPVDCWRIYPEGIKALYEDAGLETVLSEWESLEWPGYKRYKPGISVEYHGWRFQNFMPILGWLGMPVERAYDTVSVGRKK